ncbi:MAG TPA: HAD family acid phosphatase [Gemmatimonadaceae bacterium]|jgi:5'-nucleotidase (lipoprotein e(P4) family)
MTTPRTSTLALTVALLTFAAIGCSPAPIVVAAPATAPVSSNDVKFARVSAEHRAIYIETYRAAADRLPILAASHIRGSWGVILDADETVLDNSEYELARVPFGGSFDSKAWAAWVDLGRAPALPGAVMFISHVHDLGGKVVIVTNRDEAECAVTRTNLEHVSIIADLVLCKTATDDKNPRFDAVQNGNAQPGFPALAVLEWIGDNIQDFPHQSQSIRNESESAFSRFGQSFFALPNAMYGSWQANTLK